MAAKTFLSDEYKLIKKPFQKLRLTPEQEIEFFKCVLDPVYFIDNYVYVQHPTKGRVQFKLFDYQKELIRCYQNHRQTIAMCSRQLGKTATAGAFLLWFTIFQPDQHVLIAANIFKAATEIMDRIKFAYEELPDWLRPGIIKYNVTTITFDNKSKIESTATTPTSGRGKSISLLFCDELAFVRSRIAEEFWSAMGPTLATGGKCIITSTPNSDEDTFAQIWHAANRTIDEYGNDIPLGVGVNGFKAFIAHWQQHPERDEKWAAAERAKFGIEKFSREYDLKFITADSTLISSQTLTNLVSSEPLFKMGEVRWWEKPLPNNMYVVSLDPSAGVGQDYAAIQVWRLPDMVQVAEWMHNRTDISGQLRIMIQITSYIDREMRKQTGQYSDPEIFWTFENNSYGQAVVELLNEFGLDIIPGQLISEPTITTGKVRRGLNTNGRTKSQACTKLKYLVESNQLTIRSKALVSQLKNYVTRAGSFAAKPGDNDDLVAALLLIVRMSQNIARWDDNTAARVRTNNLVDIEDLEDPLPISVSIW